MFFTFFDTFGWCPAGTVPNNAHPGQVVVLVVVGGGNVLVVVCVVAMVVGRVVVAVVAMVLGDVLGLVESSKTMRGQGEMDDVTRGKGGVIDDVVGGVGALVGGTLGVVIEADVEKSVKTARLALSAQTWPPQGGWSSQAMVSALSPQYDKIKLIPSLSALVSCSRYSASQSLWSSATWCRPCVKTCRMPASVTFPPLYCAGKKVLTVNGRVVSIWKALLLPYASPKSRELSTQPTRSQLS